MEEEGINTAEQYLQKIHNKYPERAQLYRANIFDVMNVSYESRLAEVQRELTGLVNLGKQFGKDLQGGLQRQEAKIMEVGFGSGASSEALVSLGANWESMTFVDADESLINPFLKRFGVNRNQVFVYPKRDKLVESGIGGFIQEFGNQPKTSYDLVFGMDVTAEMMIMILQGIKNEMPLFTQDVSCWFTSTQPAPGPWKHWDERRMVEDFIRENQLDSKVDFKSGTVGQNFDENDVLVEETIGYIISSI